MPMPGGPKPLQSTHEYSHKRIQNKQIRGLGRKTHAHMPCTYRHRHTQNTCIHTRAYTYTDTSGSTETQKNSRDVNSPLEVDELVTTTSETTKVLAKVSRQGPNRMDGCVVHASMVIDTSHKKADEDSHTHIYNAYIHSGQSEILLRVLSQNQNRKPLKGCLTLHAEAQKAETTPGHSDAHTRLYNTEPEPNQKCSEEETG